MLHLPHNHTVGVVANQKVDPDRDQGREVDREVLEGDIEVAGIRGTIEIAEIVAITVDADLDPGQGRGHLLEGRFHLLALRKYIHIYLFCCSFIYF